METDLNFLGLPEKTSQSIYMPYLSTNYNATSATNTQTNQATPSNNMFQEDILASSAGIFQENNAQQTNTYATTQDITNINNYTDFNVPTTTEAYPATNYTTSNEAVIPTTTNY